MSEEWLVGGATHDSQTVTGEWMRPDMKMIEGVQVKEVKHVPKTSGYLTEIYRCDWGLDDRPVDQIFQVVLLPGQISAWHAHATTLDRLFVSIGLARIALFDRRKGSSTFGIVNEFKIGEIRPALIVIPPTVWHGIQNIGATPAIVLNIVDSAYRYQSPDHWRAPLDSSEIPFSFSGS